MKSKMKKIGLILVLSSLISCNKEIAEVEYIPLGGPTDISLINKPLKDSVNNSFKEFNKEITKGTLVPTWTEGDLICVYSIQEDNTISFIDTCAVYDVNKNYGHIKAEVSKECLGYFAVYPYNTFNYSKGDKIKFSSDRNLGGSITVKRDNFNGLFEGNNIMTSWCDWCPENEKGFFWFISRVSFLRINNVKPSDFPLKAIIYFTPTITYTTPTISSFSKSSYYVVLSSNETTLYKIIIYPKSNSGKDPATVWPKESIKPGFIYNIDIKSLYK